MGPLNPNVSELADVILMPLRTFCALSGATPSWTTRAVDRGDLEGPRDPAGRTFVSVLAYAKLVKDRQYQVERDKTLNGALSVRDVPRDSNGLPLEGAAASFWFARRQFAALESAGLLTHEDRLEFEQAKRAAGFEMMQREGL